MGPPTAVWVQTDHLPRGDLAAPSGAYVSGQMIGRAVPLEGGDVVVVGGPREANVA